nr:trehalase family glycosidase [Allomuricauda sp.]
MEGTGMDKYFLSLLAVVTILLGCNDKKSTKGIKQDGLLHFSKNILDYTGTPKNVRDRSMLMYSDQGAWFAYGLPPKGTEHGGFSGPFLMTQENGVWASQCLTSLQLTTLNGHKTIDWKNTLVEQKSYSSHLERHFSDSILEVKQTLVFLSGHTAMIKSMVTNMSKEPISLKAHFSGNLFKTGIHLSKEDGILKLASSKSNAMGYVQFLSPKVDLSVLDDHSYMANSEYFDLKPGDSIPILVSQTFIFPEYSWPREQQVILDTDFNALLKARQQEKGHQLSILKDERRQIFSDSSHLRLLAKAQLTLQNNWRIPAGELRYQGLFPSYHYEWFHGFWSWDSWKHAVGLADYAPQLAKDQVRAMFYFQKENGFIVDCVYRDTTIEPHNYRDTKPPLAAWAVAKIVRKHSDTAFVREMYPKLKKYHKWWYADRDHDQDGLCEYGATDGTLIAAKWESGMDNAIRFDDSKIVQNSSSAYSLDQESVDLNAYLYAEKAFLAELAGILQLQEEVQDWEQQAFNLKQRIQEQFFDPNGGWFYDTNLEGNTFINGAGSEGWIPLWAKVATQEQAEAIKIKMMDPTKFFVKVPFQTMSADHPKFDPMNGYWRGPNWLDQAYFGIKGLRNYGYGQEADRATARLLNGGEGILELGAPIHENYHPLTGKGLYAKNFSWSAAHLIMLLTNDK